MKSLVQLFLILVLLSSCASLKTDSKKFLPKKVHQDAYFNMPLADFIKIKGDAVEYQQEDKRFRKVYLELIEDEAIEGIVYYFDTEDQQPLYEIIIAYKTEILRDKAALKLLGKPNIKSKEWKIKNGNKPEIWAWTHNNKLIITALIPKTEWYEEINK